MHGITACNHGNITACMSFDRMSFRVHLPARPLPPAVYFHDNQRTHTVTVSFSFGCHAAMPSSGVPALACKGCLIWWRHPPSCRDHACSFWVI